MTRHTTHIDPGLDPVLMPLVHAADEQLEAILGDISGRVTATWMPGTPDADLAPTATLELNDAEVTRSQEFTRRELAESTHLRYDLRRLMLDVLADRIRIHRRRLLESMAAGDGD
ncbi:MAG TPA: hypothetical protein VH092_12920 [Urbifossiella sp.]|jgi:hypothetical protein|nr:hypothetical protein [Urbifossiella sp.]